MTVLDPGLPHGRLWVANQGCSCAPCVAARNQAAHVAVVERDRVVKPPTRQQLRSTKRQRPHWVHNGHRAYVAIPQGVHETGDEVVVYSNATGRTTTVTLGRKVVTPYRADGVELDRFEPARGQQ